MWWVFCHRRKKGKRDDGWVSVIWFLCLGFLFFWHEGGGGALSNTDNEWELYG